MAKICPLTNDTVLYVDCLECECKIQCKNGEINISEKKMEEPKRID